MIGIGNQPLQGRFLRFQARVLLLGLGAGCPAVAVEGEPFSVTVPLAEPPGGMDGGRRWAWTGDRLEISQETFPEGGVPRALPVPEHLGGGFLFAQRVAEVGGRMTRLYRAPSWPGALEPWSAVPLAVEQIGFGPDRIYLHGASRTVALSLEGQRLGELGSLPLAAHYQDVQFVSRERGQLTAPLLGVLRTTDAGRTWQAGEPSPSARAPLESSLAGAAGSAFGGADAEAPWPGPRLSALVAEGVRLGSGAMFRLGGSRLESMLMEPGALRLEQRQLGSDFGRCFGLPGSHGLLVCWSMDAGPGSTDLVRISDERAPTVSRLFRLQGRRRLLARGEGGALLDGQCSDGMRRGYCLLSEGERVTVARSSREEPLAVGTDGRQILEVTRSGDKERVEFIIRDLRSGKVRSVGTPREGERGELATGQALSELWVRGSEVSFWATHGDRFVGIKLGANVEFGPIQEGLSRAGLIGARALVRGALGFGRETFDGGLTWSEVELPKQNAAKEGAALSHSGCTDVGCLWDSHVRLGWGREPVSVAPSPEPVALPPLGGGPWRLECVAGSAPVPSPAACSSTQPDEQLRSSGGLFEACVVPGPVRQARPGSWVLAEFLDPFSTARASSLPTFGLLPNGGESLASWGFLEGAGEVGSAAAMDSGAGALFIASGAGRGLFFAPRERLAPVDLPRETGARSLAGIARVAGRLYVGYRGEKKFVVYELRASAFRRVFEFPLVGPSGREVRLVEDPGRQLGILLDGDSGTFIYPVGLDGDLGTPLVAPFQSTRPRACAETERGFVYVRELGVAPRLESAGEELHMSRVSARLILGSDGLCLAALSARSAGDDAISSTWSGPADPARGGVPLVVHKKDALELFCR